MRRAEGVQSYVSVRFLSVPFCPAGRDITCPTLTNSLLETGSTEGNKLSSPKEITKEQPHCVMPRSSFWRILKILDPKT